MTIEYNISRLYYLLDMYKMSVDELLALLNEDRKTPIVREELEKEEIKLSLLKKIDEVFKKGINFYLDPRTPQRSSESSIFFRKEKFNSDLNLGSKKIVTHFEDFKNNFTAIAKLSEVQLSRKVPVFTINQNPKQAANAVSQSLYPEFKTEKRDFLKSFIDQLGSADILVSEFVETWNKKERVNIDGFFLAPNVIVLKRQQTSLRREIFTLAHELGHYLLNEEEVESIDFADMYGKTSNKIENWCNEFAFYFLAGKYADTINQLTVANASNDYHMELIAEISKKTHLSRLALYTRLLLDGKIAYPIYQKIKQDFEEQFRIQEAKLKKQRELDKLAGIESNARVAQPIKSTLLISTLQTAYYEGVINEYDFCRTLNIQPDKLPKYLQ
ncbi:MAG: ImmA/IrrE family metallo-endopeptidase [Paludibacter sp.]|nr:ImmA/IrrE family metallo-endopeptidase [Paludibacter sp.]